MFCKARIYRNLNLQKYMSAEKFKNATISHIKELLKSLSGSLLKVSTYE